MYGYGSLVVLALVLISSIGITVAATILSSSTISSSRSTSTSARDVPSQSSTEVGSHRSVEFSTVGPVLTVEQECGIRGEPPSNNDTGTKTDYSVYGEKLITSVHKGGGTVLGEFPWTAALLKVKTNSNSTDDDEIICGASIISPFIILTAAHCVNKIIEIKALKVRVGGYNVGSHENETLPHQDRTVNAIHIHPNYDPKRLYNDLALLSVNKPFVYDSYINGICVPLVGTPYGEKHSYDPEQCWDVGWEKHTIQAGGSPRLLKKVTFIVNHDECQQKLRATKLGTKFILDSSFVCAKEDPYYDTCRYTAGGTQLFCISRANHNKVIQVGVVSWDIGCSHEMPRMYASLEANSEWLTNEINTMSAFKTSS
ncbi:phenoloxidase-activating factor 2-like [Planococcus citri]|uniref:phenoloxidase-activating factor 2-like n=1 Tax=Planococcus citri TaxID=170843 RepID=UPI0031FA18AF